MLSLLLTSADYVVCLWWTAVSHQDPDWRVRLKNFDSIYSPSADSSTPSPAPRPVTAEMDLGQEETNPTHQPPQPMETSPDQMSQEQFTTTLTATVQITVGQGQVLTCSLVDGKAFLMSATKTKLAGINSSGARPIFLYAGGAWVSDSAKARR